MFGRFLEISLNTEDIAASVSFYEQLGFTQLTTGDTWGHPYGVLSDGRLCIGLHQRRGPTPMLSFVHPELVRHVHALREAGFESHYTRLGESDFHELQLRDPAGQSIALLEARTFSPPRQDVGVSLCGWFSAYSVPTLDAEAVQAYWERAGFVAVEMPDDPLVQFALTSDTLTMTVHRPRALAAPALVFTDPDMSARLERLAAQGFSGTAELPRGLDRRANAVLEAPEGTLLLLLSADA